MLRLSIDYLGTLDKEAVAKGLNEEGKVIRLIAIAPTIVTATAD